MNPEKLEQVIDDFFSSIDTIPTRSLSGYVLIIALILVLFPNDAGIDLAVRLANWLVPLTFFVLGGVFMNVLSWMFNKILPRRKQK